MLSPLFYNFKYSKSRILETLKFNIITKNWKTPLIALGGISLLNFKKLKITRVTGIGFKKFIEQV
jgi:thiamine monophosphate synthase